MKFKELQAKSKEELINLIQNYQIVTLKHDDIIEDLTDDIIKQVIELWKKVSQWTKKKYTNNINKNLLKET